MERMHASPNFLSISKWNFKEIQNKISLKKQPDFRINRANAKAIKDLTLMEFCDIEMLSNVVEVKKPALHHFIDIVWKRRQSSL